MKLTIELPGEGWEEDPYCPVVDQTHDVTYIKLIRKKPHEPQEDVFAEIDSIANEVHAPNDKVMGVIWRKKWARAIVAAAVKVMEGRK